MRKEGFYWVKLKLDFAKKHFANENFEPEYEIANWYGNSWSLCGEEHGFYDSDFEEINENKIQQKMRV